MDTVGVSTQTKVNELGAGNDGLAAPEKIFWQRLMKIWRSEIAPKTPPVISQAKRDDESKCTAVRTFTGKGLPVVTTYYTCQLPPLGGGRVTHNAPASLTGDSLVAGRCEA